MFELKKVFILKVALSFIGMPQFSMAEQKITVALASNSSVKKAAVFKAFRFLYPNRSFDLQTYSAKSEVADQPVGEKYGVLGAENRLSHAKLARANLTEGFSPIPDYWVSIENYIESRDDSQGDWMDRGAVIVQKGSDEPVLEFSEPVSFSQDYAQEALRQTDLSDPTADSGYSVTVGKLIQKDLAQRGQVVAHDDWQGHPEFGNQSRELLLEEAIIRAVVKSEIQLVQGFKKSGVLFRDMTPLLSNPEVFHASIQLLAKSYQSGDRKVDAVAGLEARGFLIGLPLALEMKVPFIPIRKKGKLPNPSFSESYETEYSRDKIEISATDLDGKTILIADDLLATGGTLSAAEKLLKRAGAAKTFATCLIELPSLKGRLKLESEFSALIQY